MALVKKTVTPTTTSASTEGKSAALAAREAEAQRKKARTLGKQQQAAERIAAATGQLSSGINEAASAAEELKRSTDQIATGAEEASGAAQESLAAFTQVGASITRQLQNADVSQTKSEATQALVAKTSADIAVMITNVGVAAQRQAGSVEMVAELEKQAASIGDIVKAVARIADQTNLLALNAAIEAARAGEQGRGFAVVADEVRKLAEKTTQATSEISQMIQNIQSETRQAIDAIGHGMAEASAGVGHAREAGAALETIAVSISEVTTQVGEITSAASGQRGAADQVRASIQAIEQLNSATLSDTERGVSLTAVLAGRANSLDQAVKSFKLN